jgi:hypothetical protein
MSDLQDIIATTSIRAFKSGYNFGRKEEQEHIVTLINQHEQETDCDCLGCESWTNAFEFLKKEIKGELNG